MPPRRIVIESSTDTPRVGEPFTLQASYAGAGGLPDGTTRYGFRPGDDMTDTAGEVVRYESTGKARIKVWPLVPGTLHVDATVSRVGPDATGSITLEIQPASVPEPTPDPEPEPEPAPVPPPPPVSSGPLMALASVAERVALGPQYAVGSPDADAAYDAVLGAQIIARMDGLLSHLERVWTPMPGAVVNVTNGSPAVTGAGLVPKQLVRIVGAPEGPRYYGLRTTSPAEGTLHHHGWAWYGAESPKPWPLASATGLRVEYYDLPVHDAGLVSGSQYYDRIQTAYRYAYRLRANYPASAAALLAKCDRVAELWMTLHGDGQSLGDLSSDGWAWVPRTMALEGCVIAALRDPAKRAKWWSYLAGIARGMVWTWCWRPRDGGVVAYDMRDPGYAFSLAAMVLAGETDAARRDDLSRLVVEALAYPETTLDAQGRWKMYLDYPVGSGIARTSGDSRVSQTFTNVHMVWGLIKLWQAFRAVPELASTYPAVPDRIGAILTRAGRGLLLSYLDGTSYPNPWRASRYFDANPDVIDHQAPWPGTPIRDYGADMVPVRYDWPGVELDSNIGFFRAIGAMTIGGLAWVGSYTGDRAMLAAAADLWDASYLDPITARRAHGLNNDAAYGPGTGNGQKHWNEAYRHSQEAMAYLRGVLEYP